MCPQDMGSSPSMRNVDSSCHDSSAKWSNSSDDTQATAAITNDTRKSILIFQTQGLAEPMTSSYPIVISAPSLSSVIIINNSTGIPYM